MGQYEYSINNFLKFTEDIPQDGSIFACSLLMKVIMASNTQIDNAEQISQDAANLECQVNIYEYVRYDPKAWTNELRI